VIIQRKVEKSERVDEEKEERPKDGRKNTPTKHTTWESRRGGMGLGTFSGTMGARRQQNVAE